MNTSTAETLTTRAKREFGEFQKFWNKVEPTFKQKVPNAYQQIDKKLTQVKASLTETSSADQDKAMAAAYSLLSQLYSKQVTNLNTALHASLQEITAGESKTQRLGAQL